MDDVLSEHGWTAIEILQGIFIVTLIWCVLSSSIVVNSATFQSIDQTTTGAKVEYVIPTVEDGNIDGSGYFVVDNAILQQNSTFNWKDYVHVSTNNNINLVDFISVSGIVDTSIPGKYTLKFTLNFNGKTLIKEADYYVEEGFDEVFDG